VSSAGACRRLALAALAAAVLAATGCGGDDEPAGAERVVAYTDDRGPGAQTAPNEKLPGGQYDDPIVDGNQAVQAEETLRDFQESLATRSGSGACGELSAAIVRRLGGGAACIAEVESSHDRLRAQGSPYEPSKVLAVDLRGLDDAVATIQDGDGEPVEVRLHLVLAEQRWVLASADLGEPMGFTPAAKSRDR